MSGIYIPGMEMPKSCLACEWCVHTIPADNFICYRLNRAVIGVAEEDVNETVNACCPLIPVPEHGRLGDLDALADVFRGFIAMYDSCPFSQLSLPDKARRDELQSALAEVINAPTIIPAEEGE